MKHSRVLPLLFAVLVSLNSCVTLNSGPSHCVPTFTDKNQFQSAVCAGLSGVSANIAYSPLKYFSIHASGFTALPGLLPREVYTSRINLHNHQLEGGFGFYYPTNSFIYGCNLGYGRGSISWERWYRPDSGNRTPFFEEKFDTKWKIYMNAFFAFKIKKESFSGLSFKYSYYSHYYYLSTLYSDYVSATYYYKDQFVNGQSFSLSHFMQLKISKHIYFINEGGFCFSSTAIPALILRAGFMFKF